MELEAGHWAGALQWSRKQFTGAEALLLELKVVHWSTAIELEAVPRLKQGLQESLKQFTVAGTGLKGCSLLTMLAPDIPKEGRSTILWLVLP